MKKKLIKLIIISLPIFIGFLIYLVFRSKSLFYFNIFRLLGLEPFILLLREYASTHRELFPTWTVYSLPDGLWLLSFGLSIYFSSRRYFFNLFIFTSITIFMIYFESFQKEYGGHGTVIGTYDIKDIYCYLGSFFILFLLFIKKLIFKKKNTEENASFLSDILSLIKIIIIFSTLAVLPTLLGKSFLL